MIKDTIDCQTEYLIAALVETWINNIEMKSYLEKEQIQILTEFADIFNEIPHADELPNNVLAAIKLKDANKIIQI